MDNSYDVVIKKKLKFVIGSAQNEAVRYLIDNELGDDGLLFCFDQYSYIEKGQLLSLANHLILEK